LQDWEDEQLPPVFEGLLQQGNAAGAAGGNGAAGNAAGVPEDPLGGLLGAILAPQGGFHAHNQHGHNNAAHNGGTNNNNNNHDGGDVAAGGAAAAAAGGAAGVVADPAGDAAADAVLDQLLQELQQDQQQHQQPQPPQQQQDEGAAEPWQQINPWQPVDWGIVPLIPQPAAALAAAPHPVAGQQQQQQQLAGTLSATAPAAQAPQLSDAPVARAYGDVLRGQRCLRSLDVCVTALCKVMRASNTALSQLRQLRLHMLGEVRLPAGGLPWLPLLTRLEFYLPDERNWGERYCYATLSCLTMFDHA
jgi:hypothetical protein